MSAEDTAEWGRIVASGILARLTKQRIHEAIKILNTTRNTHYVRRRERKRGPLVEKSFRPEDYEKFYAHSKNSKCTLACKTMQYLGLRVGEAASLHESQIHLGMRKLYLKTSKSGIFDVMDLHDAIYALLKNWMETHADEIAAHGGYLFWNESPSNRSPHLSKEFLRVYVYRTCLRAGLDEFYGVSEERYEGRRPRKLRRLSSHSNRHSFITRVHLATGDLLVTQRAARHTDLSSTAIYAHIRPERVWSAIRKAMTQEPTVEFLTDRAPLVSLEKQTIRKY
jgi:integrase